MANQYEIDDDDFNEQEDDTQENTYSPKDTIVKVAVGLTMAVLSLLICFSIYISTRSVPFSMRLYGPGKMVAGEPSCLRVAIFDNSLNRFSIGIQGTIELLRQGMEPIELFQGEEPRGRTLEANFTTPKLPPGRYTLRVAVKFPKGEDSTEVPVEILKSFPTGNFLSLKDEDVDYHTLGGMLKMTEKKGDDQGEKKAKKEKEERTTFNLTIYPESGILLPNLNNTVLVLARDLDGNPIYAEVQVRGIKNTIYTNEHTGLGVFQFFPKLAERLFINASDGKKAKISGSIEVAPGHSQIISMVEKTIFPKGQDVEVFFETLRLKGEMFMDLYYKGIKIMNKVGPIVEGTGSFTFKVPRQMKGFLAARIFLNFNVPTGNENTRLVFLSGAMTKVDKLDDLVQDIQLLSGGAKVFDLVKDLVEQKQTEKMMLEQTVTAVMQRIKTNYPQKSLVLDTFTLRQSHLDERKTRLQSKISTIILLFALVVISLIFYFAIKSYIKTHRLIAGGSMASYQSIAMIVVLLGVLAFAFYSIVIMLENLKWGIQLIS